MKRPMRLGTRVWSLGKLFVLAGTLLATFLVFFGLSMRAALQSREVKVPALVGRSVGDATQLLDELGLPVRVDENRRSDDKILSGRIMQQDPARWIRSIGLPADIERSICSEAAGRFLAEAL